MAAEWQQCKIGDLFTLHPGFAFSSRDFTPSGVPVIKIKNVKANGLNLEDFSYVDRSFLETRSAYIVFPDDILITLSGNRLDGSKDTWVGKVAQFRERGSYLLNQRVAVLRPKPDVVVDKRCCSFILSSEAYQQLFIAIATSSGGQANLSSSQVLRADIRMPPLAEQRAIAKILGALDDKIELNRHMNETLEAMARAIFKSWFVDFDPVRAKAKSRQPFGMDAQTAALFPSSLVDSARGKVPKGWKTGKLDQIVDIHSGGTPKTSIPEYWNGDVPWFSVVDAPRPSDVFVVHTEKSITNAGADNSAAVVLPAGTTIISARGTVGKLALMGVPMAINQSCYGITGRSNFGNYFTYFHLQDKVDELAQSTHGTVFDTITRQTFGIIDCLVPPPELTQSFDVLAKPLLQRILANLFASRTLGSIRDALLPKLISGEIRVRDAEKVVGEKV